MGAMESTTALEHMVVRASSAVTLREIEDVFIFAGAEPTWRESEPAPFTNRQVAAKVWIHGIKTHAPDKLRSILLSALQQLGEQPEEPQSHPPNRSEETKPTATGRVYPSDIADLLDRLTKGIARAAFPLVRRRKGKPVLALSDEYDVQDLFHSMLRPWVKDVRAEEYTPSYALTSTRVDFLLKRHRVAVELKFVRDARHSRTVHDELSTDLAHYRAHPDVDVLWAIVFDPSGHISNPAGLGDLAGQHQQGTKSIDVVCYLAGSHGADRITAETE